MRNFDICIIGAGASGLMCASTIKDKSVVIIDKNDKIGKKILVTGNGRCNLTNININTTKYNTTLVNKYFKRFSSIETREYFSKLGLMTYNDNQGRVYPISDSANSVLDVLRNSLGENITFWGNTTILYIEKVFDNFKITLSDKSQISANKIVLALGGNADLNFISKEIKIPLNKYIPSLGGLKTDLNKDLNNIRVPNTNVKLIDDDFTERGEVLFKNNSISGIVIFNLSAHLSRKNDFKSKISLDFLPDIDTKSLSDMLLERKKNLKNLTCEHFLTGIFHKALCKNILEKSGIDKNTYIEKINKNQIEILVNLIKNYQLTTYDICVNNQVYSGGVPLKSLQDNFMLKTAENVYVTGEMIDVDGECGGYNLQWAWTSGYLCGKSL